MNKPHVLYVASDFTEEEIKRENIIAVKVIKEGLDICKMCGKFESGLEEPCESPKQKRIRLWDES